MARARARELTDCEPVCRGGRRRSPLYDRGLRGDLPIAGRTDYLSPEQAAGNPTSAAADQYAIGVLAYHLLIGRQPIEAESMLDAFSRKIRGEIRPIRDHRTSVPRVLERIVERAMATDPGDRFPRVADLESALREFLARPQLTQVT